MKLLFIFLALLLLLLFFGDLAKLSVSLAQTVPEKLRVFGNSALNGNLTVNGNSNLNGFVRGGTVGYGGNFFVQCSFGDGSFFGPSVCKTLDNWHKILSPNPFTGWESCPAGFSSQKFFILQPFESAFVSEVGRILFSKNTGTFLVVCYK